MASWGQVDFSDFVALRDRLQRLLEFDLDDFCKKMTKEITSEVLKRTIERIHSISGDLAKGWNTPNDVVKIGNTYQIEKVNPVEYAEFVEFGHRTANHNGWVNGKFMLTISEREIQREVDQVIQRKLEALLREVMGN